MHAATDPHLAGVGEGDIDIGAHGLGSEAELPFVGFSSHIETSALRKEKGSFSLPCLKLMRALLASM